MPSNHYQALRPMLATAGAEAFDSAAHIFDLAWGGVRALAFVDRARLRLISQSGRDITAWFPELAPIAGQVRGGDTVLDGEIVAVDDGGQPDLALLASRLTFGALDHPPNLVYQAYDLLVKAGRTLIDQPLERRRADLRASLRGAGPAVVSDWVDTDGVACFDAVATRRLPGIVAKEKESLYLPGRRSAAWQEIRVYESGWFVVGGYILGVGREGPVAGMLLGEPGTHGRLVYAGTVQAGFPGGDLEAAVSAFSSPACPFLTTPPIPRLVYWARPELVCEVRYAGHGPDARLRFPVFVTLRPDLGPADCSVSRERENAAVP